MRRTIVFALLILGMMASLAAEPERKRSTKPAKQSTMTGCVDETKDGNYVLTGDAELQPIADLEGDGFDKENFAKHMGHKVTVSGQIVPRAQRPLIRVRSIQTLSTMCAPPEKP